MRTPPIKAVLCTLTMLPGFVVLGCACYCFMREYEKEKWNVTVGELVSIQKRDVKYHGYRGRSSRKGVSISYEYDYQVGGVWYKGQDSFVEWKDPDWEFEGRIRNECVRDKQISVMVHYNPKCMSENYVWQKADFSSSNIILGFALIVLFPFLTYISMLQEKSRGIDKEVCKQIAFVLVCVLFVVAILANVSSGKSETAQVLANREIANDVMSSSHDQKVTSSIWRCYLEANRKGEKYDPSPDIIAAIETNAEKAILKKRSSRFGIR